MTHSAQTKDPSEKNWSPRTAALLSFLLPGSGQMYKGEHFKGFLWLLAVVITAFYAVIPAVLLNLLCVAEAAFIDTSNK